MQGKGFEPQITGTIMDDRGGSLPINLQFHRFFFHLEFLFIMDVLSLFSLIQ